MNQIRKISAVIIAFAWIFVLAHALTPHGHTFHETENSSLKSATAAPWWVNILEFDLGTHHLEYYLHSGEAADSLVATWQLLLLLAGAAFVFAFFIPVVLAIPVLRPDNERIVRSTDAFGVLVLRGPPIA